jgi:hypothetical protein
MDVSPHSPRVRNPAFDSAKRNGRYWEEIAFFTDCRSRRSVRHALIETLDDRAAPAMVQAWAAERLHLHIFQETVRACLRAVEDPDPEVRLWAVYTLGKTAAASCDGPTPYIGMLWVPSWKDCWRTMPWRRDGGQSVAKPNLICHVFTRAMTNRPDCRLRFK